MAASAWRRRPSAALLKLLALAPGHQLHQDQVLEHLWPDVELDAAVRRLYTAVYFARRALESPVAGRAATPAGTDLLQLSGLYLTLCPTLPLWLDFEAFEAAAVVARERREPVAYEAALALYGGDLLPDEPYAEWVAPRREQLRSLYLALLGELARLCEARQQPAQAIEAWQRAVAHEPVYEAAHVRLMHLYAESGQRAQALRQYQRLREALQHDLDAAPARETQGLHRAIFTGQLTASAPAQPPAVREPPPVARPGNNLPHPLTAFIGRTQARATLRDLLRTSRLVTLTGVAGSGKTRLAVQVATELARAGDYPDGIWFVELGDLRLGELVAAAIARCLGLREQPGQAVLDTLSGVLRERTALLVLDNCEHLIDPCVEIVQRLLPGCPNLTLLSTSRQALGVMGEVVFPVPPLMLPARPSGSTVNADVSARAALTDAEAVQLFVDRARLAQPGFALTDQNAEAIGEICQRLDGLPLAIELAAARVRLLGLESIAARLGDRFRLLTEGNRTAPPRHQTLRAAIEWSYELLTEPERTLFNRLAVFAGGFTLDAAEAVCADDAAADVTAAEPSSPSGLARDEVLDLLGRLIDRSLVQAEPTGAATTGDGADEVRYRLLETLREFGLGRLATAGLAETARRRHTDYFLALAEDAAQHLGGPDESRQFATLEREHANLRDALRRSLDTGETVLALRFCAALWRFWEVRGYVTEGLAWLDEALVQAGDGSPMVRAQALNGAGGLARIVGDYARAEQRNEEALSLWQGLDHRAGAAVTLHNLGLIARDRGNYQRARERLTAGLAVFEELGDLGHITNAQLNLGRVARGEGDLEAAAARFDEALRLARAQGYQQSIAATLNGLGEVARDRADLPTAETLHRESLALHRQLGDRWGAALSLYGLARVAHRRAANAEAAAHCAEALDLVRDLGVKRDIAACLELAAAILTTEGLPRDAAELLGAAAALRAAGGIPLAPADRPEHAGIAAAVEAALGPEAAASADGIGRRRGLESAIALAMELLGRVARPGGRG